MKPYPTVETPAEAPGRLAVAIATTGRAPILIETVRALAVQDRLPDLLLISVTSPDDILPGTTDDLPFPVEVLTGPKGASRQRNRALERLGADDLVLFIDDDFLLSPDYLAQVVRLFETHPDIALLTGTVLADGIGGAGFDHGTGHRLLAERRGTRPANDKLTETYGGYGCNMAVRMRPVVAHQLRFDERLPLYSWLEDIDFSRRLAPHGRIVLAGAMTGVHLGTKTGRQKGVLLGYSQVANPIYLIRKGTMHRRRAMRLMSGNILANVVRSVRPEPWVDRRGRLYGNLLAFRDAITGRMAPDRILDLS